MKRLISLLPLLILTGCQWILTHPSEDEAALEILKEAGTDIYQYETRTLSPTPPLGVPPMKLKGPSGPGVSK